MTTPVIEASDTWHRLVSTRQELDVPDGWRVEIEGGKIIVSPPPANTHNVIAARIQRALVPVTPENCEIFQTLGVSIAPLFRLYIPDVVVMPLDDIRVDAKHDTAPTPARYALLIAEVTSKDNANHDRVTKLEAYARAQVPLYLLVDRWDKEGPSVTLFSAPDGKKYHGRLQVPIGASIAIPEPFGIDLDTAMFQI
ncbi:Uma2 family endonuclease [Embleya sp. NBC_00896]|uniref:Uma2 family endonuclease n=1 Tax=Embleya sp. NBC_00896 TaxID=2975961 RepID=UPI0038689DC3|nr:Uma2 family endonuclease [Embleya sp. NBC_00896]